MYQRVYQTVCISGCCAKVKYLHRLYNKKYRCEILLINVQDFILCVSVFSGNQKRGVWNMPHWLQVSEFTKSTTPSPPCTAPSLDLRHPYSSWEILLNNEKTISLPENEFVKLRVLYPFARCVPLRLCALREFVPYVSYAPLRLRCCTHASYLYVLRTFSTHLVHHIYEP